MSIHTEFAGLAADVAETFGMTVTLRRANQGGAFDPQAGTEVGGSTISAQVRANRIGRMVREMPDGGGGFARAEITTYEITLADLAESGWTGGDPMAADLIEEPADFPGDGRTRRIARLHRLPATPVIRIETQEAAAMGG